MTALDIGSIEDIVNGIEVDIFEVTDCEECNVTVSSNGFVQLVDFAGIQIWNSEADDVFEHYQGELFEKMLRERLNVLFAKLGTVHL